MTMKTVSLRNVKPIDGRYPLIPLRNTVLFPGNVLPLFVGRDKSMESTQVAMQNSRLIAFFSQKDSKNLNPTQNDLYEYGVLGEILQLLKMPDGTLKILVEGIHRIQLQDLQDLGTHFEVTVSHIKSQEPEKDSLQEKLLDKLVLEIVESFRAYNQQTRKVSDDFFTEILEKSNPSSVIDSVSPFLAIPFAEKQKILETIDIIERAKVVKNFTNEHLEMQTLENSLQEKVGRQMDNAQKKYFLNEKIKVIKEELGEDDESEFKELEAKIQEKNLPQEIRDKAESELRKLKKTPPFSIESTIIQNYLDWIVQLPWKDKTEENEDIAHAARILDDSHYGLEKVKERILEFIAVKTLSPDSRGPILCLAGPPGVGKTSLARSVAESLNRPFVRISLGGVRDEAEIRGHRRTYIGALPGRIISALKKAKAANPLILLDEIDKLSSDQRGNPAAALLEVLDPEQNREFLDHYMELPVDLSQVLFLTTANAVHTIPEPLLDRLELIHISGYTEREKINIAQKHIIPNQIIENGIQDVVLKYNEKSIAFIIRHYTREAGVRQLQRELSKVARKIAREYLEEKTHNTGKSVKYLLDKTTIVRFLGREQYQYGKTDKGPFIGRVHGLAWTQSGGDILNIEAALSFGKGNVMITGNLGDVMKESVQTSIGYIRSRALFFGLPRDFFEKTDLFVHAPEGAIPKDGPSAGISITTAILSSIMQREIHPDIAMTGEITLTGKVLAIGGLKEKALAAYRGGIQKIIIPEDNLKDMDDVPAEVRENLKFIPVRTMEKVLEEALLDGRTLWQDDRKTVSFYDDHLKSFPQNREIL